MVVGVWVALAGGALLGANALDSPVGEGARDAAQPAPPGSVATDDPDAPSTSEAPATPAASLPPFAMVLDHPLPADVAVLPPTQQAEQLRVRAMRTRSPERLVELGSVVQFLGDTVSADFAYRSALKYDPESVAARVGLAVIDGGTGAAGLARSSERLRALAATHPREQLVSFNQAWVDIYRSKGAPARAALKRTVALGPGTRLGRTATTLLAALPALEKSLGGRNP